MPHENYVIYEDDVAFIILYKLPVTGCRCDECLADRHGRQNGENRYIR